jgi:hypothetical protein
MVNKSNRRKYKLKVLLPKQKVNDEIFTVHKILKMREENGVVTYLIKWRGFNAKHNSWEPEGNLIGCDLLVEEFKRAQRQKQAAGAAGKFQIWLFYHSTKLTILDFLN